MDDAERLELIESAGAIGRLYTSDYWIKRINTAKQACIQTQTAVPVAQMFDGLIEYMKPEKLNKLEQAIHDENALRFYKIWFTHYDKWYIEFSAKLNAEVNDFAF